MHLNTEQEAGAIIRSRKSPRLPCVHVSFIFISHTEHIPLGNMKGRQGAVCVYLRSRNPGRKLKAHRLRKTDETSLFFTQTSFIFAQINEARTKWRWTFLYFCFYMNSALCSFKRNVGGEDAPSSVSVCASEGFTQWHSFIRQCTKSKAKMHSYAYLGQQKTKQQSSKNRN